MINTDIMEVHEANQDLIESVRAIERKLDSK